MAELRGASHHITHGARRRQYDTLPAWQQDDSSLLHTANTHMCRYIYNQSWCSHHYRPLHFPLFVLICDITGIRDTEIMCTGSGVTDTTLETLHNPNINMTPSTPSTAALWRYQVLFVRYISRPRSVIDWSWLCNQRIHEHRNNLISTICILTL